MASETSMRAVRFHSYGPPSVLVLEEIDRPEPKAGEILIKVHDAGVNPIDWKMRAGYLQQYMPVTLPHTPGLDVSGTVASVGEGVVDFKVGDRVFGRGSRTYAEYAVAPVATIAHIPEGVSFEQAATLHVGGVTAWLGLFDSAHLEAGQRVLIQGGAGGVGSIAVQLARWKGAYVIATTSTANVEFVRSLGADEVIDYTSVNVEDAVHDVDVVFDTVGGEVTAQSWSALKPGGILVTAVGMADADVAAQRGVRTEAVGHPAETRPYLDELGALVASGALKPEIQRVFALDEAAEAQAASETGHGRGRILLHVSG
jgi:NADPH:quinone reductase-like Zn-dependent oxidoreductase